MTRLLFRVQWQQFQHALNSLRPAQFIPLIVIGLAAVIIVPMLLFTLPFIVVLLSEDALSSVFTSMFLFAIAMTLLFAIPQVFKHLFSARDVEMLFTMPIPVHSIFWVKYAQSFLSTGGIVSVLLLLILTVFGLVSSASWLFYPVLLVVSLSVVVIGMAFAYLFNLVLIQIFPANRAKELMVLMSGLAGIIVFLLIQLPNIFGRNGANGELLSILPDFPAWLPITWGGEALVRAASGDMVSVLWSAGIVAFATGVSFLASMLVERGFRTGWIRLHAAGRKGNRKTNKSLKVRHPVIFLGMKEWRAIQRDPREWMMFFPLLILVIIPAVQLTGNPDLVKELLQNPLLSWTLTQLMIIGFFALFVGTFTASSIAREGKSVWVLRTLPLSGWQIGVGKLWIHWFIPLIFVAVVEIALGLFLGWSWFWILAGVGTYALLSTGMCSIGLWMGTIGAKYNPDNPQDRLEVGTGLLLLLLNFCYLLIIALPVAMILVPGEYASFFTDIAEGSSGIFYVIVSVLGSILTAKASNGLMIVLLGIVILLVITLGITFLLLYVIAKRIDAGIQINIIQGKSRGSFVKR